MVASSSDLVHEELTLNFVHEASLAEFLVAVDALRYHSSLELSFAVRAELFLGRVHHSLVVDISTLVEALDLEFEIVSGLELLLVFLE